MTNPPSLGTGTKLDFHGPLSAERADRLTADLAAAKPSTVLDLGCGWGRLLLRVLEAVPEAHGTGVDIHGPDMVRGRADAAARGLSDRVTFVEGRAEEHLSAADLVLNVGAWHAFGAVPSTLQTLRALRPLVNPGGRLLFAAEFWERTPTADELAGMWPDTSVDSCTDLAGLVDQATTAGFRPLRIETASQGEWEEFESGYAADVEEWLAANPDHPGAEATRAKVDQHRSYWLRGYRSVWGFAYLTLG
ncbi:cyclopropane-fatty-acyl-phospholipid synthase family protein [Streptosporangium sp. 'caverna']|uniref:SAM-dependent methyltransferase n=1 Tax=Streptosporangium sp. 'caverna' TaxID=2202249 RepID=UPI000D7E2837|nr:class I SAM-dependent methyltransferase [Streptosporangium sp. 'caverna']AWS48657.1 SAM-dependent methyltransferase [Streptosporangium sp. 'caverna']